MKAIHKRRLLNVARALRESKRPDKFDMLDFVHECGTPACALGHYAARTDLQKFFRLKLVRRKRPFETKPTLRWCFLYAKTGRRAYVDHRPTCSHFGLTVDESDELFGAHGCDRARTANAAAEYIERFVARKERP